ncbi:MAG: efflux RND transporter periplasmic adaptor subunit [Candidatus Rokubacteria bacterium]|nr:efflux RND transporter periplasmic adaptor subunit [Candidatus Rokubacteria bacterium]
MRRALAALALAAAGLSGAACSDGAGGAQKSAPPPAVPVGVATVEQKVVPLQVTAVGNVQAYATVGVKSQVPGQITEVHFKEGQDVKRGSLLFTIDPRPLEAGVRQTEANVAKDKAQLRQAEAALGQRQAEVSQALANLERDLAQMANARVQEQRYRALVEKELIAREQYDQVRTNLAALQATVQADRAAVENAKASALAADAMVDNARAVIKANEAMVDTARLQLAYTTIRAPMDGRTGNLLVQAGTVVKTGEENPLVVIAQVRPIYVSFSVPQQHLTAIKKYLAAGSLKVEAGLDGGPPSPVGAVTFMNNTVDPTTGTIQLKATFPNADTALWPGQFVDVALTLTTENATVVPAPAVQAGQRGPFVFVVKPDLTVESRPVKTGRRLVRELVIEEGLAPGERVVTDGQLRLVPGARVEIKPPRPS